MDLIAVVERATDRFERRGLGWDVSGLPVAAELLVYTQDEWRRLQAEGGRFAHTLSKETVWVYPTEDRT